MKAAILVRHYLASVLGMETTSSGHDGVQSRPLLGVPFQQLRRASLPYDLTWAGRMTVLVLFVIQASGTLVLFGHRLSRGEAGEVDIRNAVVALGGLVVQLQSIGILLLNSSWHHVNEGGLYLAYQEARQGRRLFSICLTFLLMLNSYYFRQHMAFILLTVTTLNIPWGRSSYRLSYYSTGGPGRRSFRVLEFVWPVWVFLLFQGVSQHSTIMFVIAPYITLGFPIEEIARGTFPSWADPLSDRLLVF
jgi:hypothetical protein